MITAVSLAIKALSAQSSVTAITSTRIYVSPVPQGTALPAIAVALSAEDEAMLLAGSSQYPESSVQIHCLAAKGSAALDLGETVKLALRDLLFTSGAIKASFSKEPIDFQELADDQSTARRVMSFAIRWR
jgi:hypothetical protein